MNLDFVLGTLRSSRFTIWMVQSEQPLKGKCTVQLYSWKLARLLILFGSPGYSIKSVLRPLLYVLYPADLPVHPTMEIARYAGNSAIIAPHTDSETAINHLQQAIKDISLWTKNRRLNWTVLNRSMWTSLWKARNSQYQRLANPNCL